MVTALILLLLRGWIERFALSIFYSFHLLLNICYWFTSGLKNLYEILLRVRLRFVQIVLCLKILPLFVCFLLLFFFKNFLFLFVFTFWNKKVDLRNRFFVYYLSLWCCVFISVWIIRRFALLLTIHLLRETHITLFIIFKCISLADRSLINFF